MFILTTEDNIMLLKPIELCYVFWNPAVGSSITAEKQSWHSGLQGFPASPSLSLQRPLPHPLLIVLQPHASQLLFLTMPGPPPLGMVPSMKSPFPNVFITNSLLLSKLKFSSPNEICSSLSWVCQRGPHTPVHPWHVPTVYITLSYLMYWFSTTAMTKQTR